MRYLVSWLVVLGTLLYPASAAEEPDGAEIVARAVTAAGGEAWKRPRTLMLRGRMTLYRDGVRSTATEVDDYRMWREFPQDSRDAHAANGKVRFDARAGGKLVFRIAFDGEHTYTADGRIPDAAAGRQWSASFGFGIIRFADSDGFTVTRLADDQVEGHDCYFVRISDPAGSETVFGIAEKNHEVRMVGFDTPRGWHHRVYSDFAWHDSPRFRQPQRVRLYYDGRKTNDIRWEQFEVNRPLPAGTFDLE